MVWVATSDVQTLVINKYLLWFEWWVLRVGVECLKRTLRFGMTSEHGGGFPTPSQCQINCCCSWLEKAICYVSTHSTIGMFSLLAHFALKFDRQQQISLVAIDAQERISYSVRSYFHISKCILIKAQENRHTDVKLTYFGQEGCLGRLLVVGETLKQLYLFSFANTFQARFMKS